MTPTPAGVITIWARVFDEFMTDTGAAGEGGIVMSGAPPVVRRRPVPALVALFALSSLLTVTLATPAHAVDDVDLSTSIFNTQELPVAGGPDLVIAAVSNDGTMDATNVVLDVTLPAGATLSFLPLECAATAGSVTCSFAQVAAGGNASVRLFITFPATATYTVTSAHARTNPTRTATAAPASTSCRGRERRSQGNVFRAADSGRL